MSLDKTRRREHGGDGKLTVTFHCRTKFEYYPIITNRSASPSHRLESKPFPDQPGVYIFRDTMGKPVYVGKAKSLRNRLRSYFRKTHPPDPKLLHVLNATRSIEIIVTNTESEAFDLENQLIKQARPRYNILLRDDKTYPYIRLAANPRHAEITIARRAGTDDAIYYGPFFPAGLAHQITKFIRRYLFGSSGIPPFLWRPASGAPASRADVRRNIETKTHGPTKTSAKSFLEVRRLLEGHTKETTKEFYDRMTAASKRGSFEEAARYRHYLEVLEQLRQHANAARIPEDDTDVVGLFDKAPWIALTIFQFRSAEITGRYDVVGSSCGRSSGEEMFSTLAHILYLSCFAPLELVLPSRKRGGKVLEQTFSGVCGRYLCPKAPARGPLHAWQKIANRNAEVSLEEWIEGSGEEPDAPGYGRQVEPGGSTACHNGWWIVNLDSHCKPGCKRVGAPSGSKEQGVFLAVRHNPYLVATPYDFMPHRNRRNRQRDHFFTVQQESGPSIRSETDRPGVVRGNLAGREANKVRLC